MTSARPRAAIDAFPAPTAELLRAVLAEADERGLGVYAVGGPVRDRVLGREVRDADVIVEGGAAAELATACASSAARVVRHDRFGTVTLQSGEATLDLATVRRTEALPV